MGPTTSRTKLARGTEITEKQTGRKPQAAAAADEQTSRRADEQQQKQQPAAAAAQNRKTKVNPKAKPGNRKTKTWTAKLESYIWTAKLER